MDAGLKIYVKRKFFSEATPAGKVNFFNLTDFSYEDPIYYDITDHVIEVTPIKYDRAKVFSGETLELIRKCNNVNITVGTIGNTYADFFGVKSDIKSMCFEFFIEFDDITIFNGTSNVTDITYNESPYADTERIKIEIRSLLNAFLDYFGQVNCNLTEMESTFTRGLGVPNTTDCKAAYLDLFLRKMFFNNDTNHIVLNSTGYAWEMNRQPFFWIPNNGNNKYFFVTNGFRKIGVEYLFGTLLSKSDFFLKLCNAMGWDFTISRSRFTGITQLKILNRSGSATGIIISTEDIHSIDYSVGYDISEVEYIVIKDGRLKGGTNYGGTNIPDAVPVKIISLDEDFPNNGYFFSYGVRGGGPDYLLAAYSEPNYYTIANPQPDGNILDFGEVHYSDWRHFSTRYTNRRAIRNQNILYIDAGENPKMTRVDLSNAVMSLDEDNVGSSPFDIVFKGNFGSCLFTRDTNGDMVYNWDKYSRTSTFINNMKKLFYNRESDSIKIVLNRLLTEYYLNEISSVVISGDDYLNTAWDVTECELDTQSEQTKLTLKKALVL